MGGGFPAYASLAWTSSLQGRLSPRIYSSSASTIMLLPLTIHHLSLAGKIEWPHNHVSRTNQS